MKEDFIHYLWKHQLFVPKLKTTENKILEVLKPGLVNTDSGPDFFNARVRLDGTIWAGNIEIHVNSSDWFTHNHQLDPAYDNIILHVVYTDDKPVRRKNGELIPTLELKHIVEPAIYEKYCEFINSKKWIPCENQILDVDYFKRISWYDNLLIERLTEKAEIIEEELIKTGNDLQEVFYRKLARNFGFKTNSLAFEILASKVPLRLLSKHKNELKQIEALLFGASGLLDKSFTDKYPNQLLTEFSFLKEKYGIHSMDKKLWKFMRMRPSNFPTIRISQFSNLIYKSSALISHILESDKLSHVMNLLKVSASDYWTDHFRFDVKSKARKKLLGVASINLIVINTIVPYLFVYGKRSHDESLIQKAVNWLEQINSENNSITRQFSKIGIKPANAMQSQALIQLKNEYCNKKRCLECRIGHELLKPA